MVGDCSAQSKYSQLALGPAPLAAVIPPANPNALHINPSRLDAIPLPVLTMVCKSRGRIKDAGHQGCLSLPLACKACYATSHPDASTRPPLKEGTFAINRSSLILLFRLSSIPEFPKYMHTTHLRSDEPSIRTENMDSYQSFLRYENKS